MNRKISIVAACFIASLGLMASKCETTVNVEDVNGTTNA